MYFWLPQRRNEPATFNFYLNILLIDTAALNLNSPESAEKKALIF